MTLDEARLMADVNGRALGPLFPYGQTVATPGALAAFSLAGVAPEILLGRHIRGDWGDLCEEDRQMNRQALSAGERLLSAYSPIRCYGLAGAEHTCVSSSPKRCFYALIRLFFVRRLQFFRRRWPNPPLSPATNKGIA